LKAVSTFFQAGSAGTTLILTTSDGREQALGHISCGKIYFGQDSAGREAIMIHELLHVALAFDTHDDMYRRFGLSESDVAALGVGARGEAVDPLTSFLRRGCKR
jgi:hypothetical protein